VYLKLHVLINVNKFSIYLFYEVGIMNTLVIELLWFNGLNYEISICHYVFTTINYLMTK
jgi:hypothetical protein